MVPKGSVSGDSSERETASIWKVLEVLKAFRFGFLWVPEGPGMFQAVLEVRTVVEGRSSVWQIQEGTAVFNMHRSHATT